MACPLCFTAAVIETSHTESPFSPPGSTNMQDGNWTQIFHQGPFTCFPDHEHWLNQGFVGGCVQEEALCLSRSPLGRDGYRGNAFSHQAAPHSFFFSPSIARLAFTRPGDDLRQEHGC